MAPFLQAVNVKDSSSNEWGKAYTGEIDPEWLVGAPQHAPGLTIAPPSSYARRIPLYTHPSTAIVRPGRRVWKFQPYIALAPDPTIRAKNAPDHPNRTNADTIGGEGLEWGAWLTFHDKRDEITSTSLAFLVDIFTNMPNLMPPSERPALSWFPTIVLAMEFKAPIPRSSAHAKRTVGLYSSGKFLNDGRHDGYVEVWTAPCDIGEGEEVAGWRENQICVAIATQMASIIPMEVNMKRGKSETKLVPNGGYILALLVDACIQHQSKTNHQDPIHVTAHFLRSSQPTQFEIRVRTLRTGRGFTNLTAELYQQGTVTVSTQQIFGINSTESHGLTLTPPSPYARRIPLYTHPSTAIGQPPREVAGFRQYMTLATDSVIMEKNEPNHPNRANASTVGGAGLEWGAWFSFKDQGDQITKQSLPFLVDIFAGLPFLMPRSERPDLGTSWFPTMVLAIEFKAPIPHFSSDHANRSVGIYFSGKFVNDGRHDSNVEVWTAPCNVGEGKETPGWREKQVCLATATQMAYIVPMEVNLQRGKKKGSKL
ncbi:hypothetical protein H0H87_006170 [Tephrocybe sp. NHM501043]|nr:hypothetical protein H0H87_006170 [Tephrocybe sp. NHM501043]